ncbi:MAG: hypothetical protein V1740_03360 [Candidatus Woesearchaeota archaeon]
MSLTQKVEFLIDSKDPELVGDSKDPTSFRTRYDISELIRSFALLPYDFIEFENSQGCAILRVSYNDEREVMIASLSPTVISVVNLPNGSKSVSMSAINSVCHKQLFFEYRKYLYLVMLDPIYV